VISELSLKPYLYAIEGRQRGHIQGQRQLSVGLQQMENEPATRDDVPQEILFEESPDKYSLVIDSMRPLGTYLRLGGGADVILLLILLVPFLAIKQGWTFAWQSGCLILIAFTLHIVGVLVSYSRNPKVFYRLTKNALISEGGLTKNQFELPIAEIEKVIAIPRLSGRTDLVVYSKGSQFVFPGMSRAKQLTDQLPERLAIEKTASIESKSTKEN
jgi:hypothetical protein